MAAHSQALSSSSSEGDTYSDGQCEKIEDFSHDGSSQGKQYLNTNASSTAVSPNLSDKPLVVANKYETALLSESDSEEFDFGAQRDTNVFGSAAENDKILATFFDISKYKLEYSNLNDCVSALLKKAKEGDASQRDIKRR